MLLPRSNSSTAPVRRGGAYASLLLVALALAGCAHQAAYTAKPLSPDKLVVALEARTLDDPGLRKFLTENLHQDFSPGQPVTWDFETLCWVAFYYNPTLDVARAQWESARAAQISAGARPNPTLTLTPGFSSNPGGASPWIPAVGLDFGLDPAGQRDRRTEVARLTAEAARQAVFAAAWQVHADLRRAINDFTFADTRTTALRAQLELSQQILALLEQRRAAGAASAGDVSAAQLALIRAESAASDAQSQLGPARQRVAQLLGVPVTAITGVELHLMTRMNGPYAPELLAAVRRRALQSRADVLGALARYAVAESSVALEVERRSSGLHLGPGYQWDQGQNKWTVAFAFELPLFNRNEGPLAEAEAHRHEAAAQLAIVQAQVLGEIDGAVAAVESAQAQADGLRPLQAMLNNQLKQVEARVRAGGADQLELKNAQLEAAMGTQDCIEANLHYLQACGPLEDALQQMPIANLDALARPAPTLASPPKP